jgi:hypothetical protein
LVKKATYYWYKRQLSSQKNIKNEVRCELRCAIGEGEGVAGGGGWTLSHQTAEDPIYLQANFVEIDPEFYVIGPCAHL